MSFPLSFSSGALSPARPGWLDPWAPKADTAARQNLLVCLWEAPKRQKPFPCPQLWAASWTALHLPAGAWTLGGAVFLPIISALLPP